MQTGWRDFGFAGKAGGEEEEEAVETNIVVIKPDISTGSELRGSDLCGVRRDVFALAEGSTLVVSFSDCRSKEWEGYQKFIEDHKRRK
jgi:hypothetical protein